MTDLEEPVWLEFGPVLDPGGTLPTPEGGTGPSTQWMIVSDNERYNLVQEAHNSSTSTTVAT